MHTGSLLTHRGYVNTWECDDRGHLNVQFYPDRFADAGAHALHALGLGPRAAAVAGLGFRLVHEHVTFQRELRASDSISVYTGVIAADAHGLTLLHELVESTSGNVFSTSTQRLAVEGGDLPEAVLGGVAQATIALPPACPATQRRRGGTAHPHP